MTLRLRTCYVCGKEHNDHQNKCSTCHRVKSYLNKDHITPGRKKLGITK